MPDNVWTLMAVVSVMAVVIGAILYLSEHYSLNSIKSRTVGDGQHGTARWATRSEIRRSFRQVPFQPKLWRKGKELPIKTQGVILGSMGRKNVVTALVDCDDIH